MFNNKMIQNLFQNNLILKILTFFKDNKRILYSILPIYILFSCVSLLTLYPKYDEYYAHIPNLQSIYNGNVIDEILSDDYLAANTPLPYLLIALPAKLLNSEPGLLTARLVNIFTSLFTILLIVFLLKKNKNNNLLYFVSIIFFYPYFLKPSFTYYMAIYGLFFFILFLIFVKRKNYYNSAQAGLFNTLAVLSQQFYLVVPGWYILTRARDYKNNGNIKSNLIMIIVFCVTLIIPLLLFANWGGLVPEIFAQHKVTTSLISLSNLTAMTVIFGGLFLFFALDNYKKIKINWLAVYLIFALLLNVFFNPQWDIIGGSGKITGYTYHALEYLNPFGFIPTLLIKIILSAIGISTLHILFISLKNNNEKIFYALILIFIIGFTFSIPLSERHILPLVILLYILILPKMRNTLLINLWLVTQIILGSIYYYYWIFLQTV